MTHKEKAEELLHQKYHCSQALFGSFASDFGLDLKTAFMMPRIRSGRSMANKKTEEFIRRFTEQMEGVTQCRDILGKDISKPEEMVLSARWIIIYGRRHAVLSSGVRRKILIPVRSL